MLFNGFRRTHLIHIPNHKDRTVTFHVTSDLDFISGPKELVVGMSTVYFFNLE